MFDALNVHVRKILVWARDEALRLSQDYIGTEHLVLAMLNDKGGVVACSLKSLGVGWNDFFRGVETVVGFGDRIETSLPLTLLAQEALRLAAVEASETGRNLAGPEHLLLGTVSVKQCVAVRVLPDLGVSLAGVRREVGQALRNDGHGIGKA